MKNTEAVSIDDSLAGISDRDYIGEFMKQCSAKRLNELTQTEMKYIKLKSEFETQVKYQYQKGIRDAKYECDEKLKNFKKNTNQTKVKPLMEEVEKLNGLLSISNDKIDSLIVINNEQSKQLIKILQMLNEINSKILGSSSLTEAKEIATSNKERIEEECKQILMLNSKGYQNKDIADILYPNLKRREAKVAERIRSDTYKKLEQSITDYG